jgi:hypothetical protein
MSGQVSAQSIFAPTSMKKPFGSKPSRCSLATTRNSDVAKNALDANSFAIGMHLNANHRNMSPMVKPSTHTL